MTHPRTGTVLIVDDEAIIRESLQHWLEMEGYRVFTAENGEKALQLCKFEHFDVGVFDIRMPGMDGITLLRQTRSSFPEMAVIMMTAFASIEDAVQCISSGAHDYVIKPFPPEKLSHAIRNLLESRQLHARQQGLLAHQDLLRQFLHQATPYLALGAATAALSGAYGLSAALPEAKRNAGQPADRLPLIDQVVAASLPGLAVGSHDLRAICATALALLDREESFALPAVTAPERLTTAAPFVPAVLALQLFLDALTRGGRAEPEIRLAGAAAARGPVVALRLPSALNAAERDALGGAALTGAGADPDLTLALLLFQQLGAALAAENEEQIIIIFPAAAGKA
ncbi:MAG TPA: response regulator [bacterium]|nr:response regulator [bacterium]HPR87220.1 response regulator [bacterium]